jgi:hypothetical protein
MCLVKTEHTRPPTEGGLLPVLSAHFRALGDMFVVHGYVEHRELGRGVGNLLGHGPSLSRAGTPMLRIT